MFKEEGKELRFEWSQLGDIELGRPNLGNTTSVVIYRLMQFTLRDAIIKYANMETMEHIFYDAGYNSGKAIYENLIGPTDNLNDLVKKLTELLKKLNIGILRFEKIDTDNMEFILTVSEDLDCSGLPINQETVCTFDEGVISGVFDSFSGISFRAKEVDCWCTGDRTCRFEVKRSKE